MISADYEAFLRTKEIVAHPAGMESLPALNDALMPHQRVLVEFALRQGRSAGFVDTGLGKSLVELEWSRVVAETTGKPVLLLTPLAGGESRESRG